MCGRYRLTANYEALQERFNLNAQQSTTYSPSYNIAPTQDILAIVRAKQGPSPAILRWGLIPSRTQPTEQALQKGHINARCETADLLPSFRDPFKHRRCLVPADTFYEWARTGERKTPFHITLKTKEPFAMAGLWDKWTGPQGEIRYTCAILTTEPNELVKDIHNRMPVILDRETENICLNTRLTDQQVLK